MKVAIKRRNVGAEPVVGPQPHGAEVQRRGPLASGGRNIVGQGEIVRPVAAASLAPSGSPIPEGLPVLKMRSAARK